MANKVTKREILNGLLNGTFTLADEVVQNYVKHEIELLDNRKANKKDTAKQKANLDLMDIILEVMATGVSGTATDIANASEDLADFSNQKISAMLKKLVESGKVKKTIEGKKSIFSLIEVKADE